MSSLVTKLVSIFHVRSLGYFFFITPSLYLSETYNKVNSIILTIIIRTAPLRTSYGVCAIDRVTKVNWQMSAMLNSDIVVILE